MSKIINLVYFVGVVFMLLAMAAGYLVAMVVPVKFK